MAGRERLKCRISPKSSGVPIAPANFLNSLALLAAVIPGPDLPETTADVEHVQERYQQADDRNDDQKFHQGESGSSRRHCISPAWNTSAELCRHPPLLWAKTHHTSEIG